ncbi:MAG: glycosyltransferase family 9 protein, partial [Bacteroidota bacterium]
MRNERLYFVVSALAGVLWGLASWIRRLPTWRRRGQKGASAGVYTRILVIRMDELGDMVTTLPLLHAIRQENPLAVVDLWCNPPHKDWLAPQGLVNTFWTGDAPTPKERYHWVLECRGNWQTLLYTLSTWPQGRRDRGSIRLWRRLSGQAQLHEWDINLRIAAPLLNGNIEAVTLFKTKGQPETAEGLGALLHGDDPQAVAEINLFKQRLDLGKYVVFHAGARKLLRRWSLQGWADLAHRLHEEFHLDIVFVGIPEEQMDVDRIQEKLNFETFTYMEGRPIRYVIPLLAQASLIVGNESGPMHLASAT